MTDNEKAASGKLATLQSKYGKHSGNGAGVQRQRLLATLRERPMSTIQIRKELDILHPGARVQELRDQGHRIITHPQDKPTECGVLHRRVAVYVLMQEAGHA
jgi:hypothetical protein